MTIRKKNKIQSNSPEVTEYDGYKVGELIYCITHGKLYRGTIDLIHAAVDEDPHFSFLDEASMTHRVARFTDIIKDPTPQQKKLVEREIRKNVVVKEK